jgi:hypothetical protein
MSGEPTGPEQTEIERERLRFERQKLAIEIRLKRKELLQQPGKGWKELLVNPLMLAVVGGFITLMTTIVSNHFSRVTSIEAETARATLADQAAQQTLQTELIKKFVESPKTETVRENLRFLVAVHLLPKYEAGINSYLQQNPTAAPQVTSSLSAVDNILSDLEAEESTARRYARTALANLGAKAIPTLVELLAKNRDSATAAYRQVLGAIEALAEMPAADRCKAYSDNPDLRHDVEKHAGIDESSLKKAAVRALSCPG